MLKIPFSRYFCHSKFVRTAGFLFALLTVFAVANVTAKNVTGGSLVESFLENSTNGTFLKSLYPSSAENRAEVFASDIIPTTFSESSERNYFAGTAAFLKLSNVSAEPESLGNYPATTVALSGNILVTPDAAPTGTTSINVSTNTNFKGQLVGDSVTGVIRVTNAHPSGIYPITITANGPSGLVTKTFNLTVQSTTYSCAGITFSSSNTSVPNVPISVAVGDFNTDGNQDIVSGTSVSGISILIGNGSGGFAPPVHFPVGAGSQVFSVAVSDFNGDGKQDLAVANGNPGIVSIFIGDGTGGFAPPVNYAVGPVPMYVVTGDFNGDSKQDVATANSNATSVSILLGNGVGGFSNAVNFDTGFQPEALAVGDFKGDSKLDLATVSYISNTLSILIGNGTGGFIFLNSYSVGVQPRSIVVADFNSDGKQDIATGNYGTNNVSILLGNGNAGFSGAVNYDSPGPRILGVVVGDFNGDDKIDLAIANSGVTAGSNGVSVLVGNGNGGFAYINPFPLEVGGRAVAVGDFNGDNKQDSAAADIQNQKISILLRTCAPPVFSITGQILSGTNGLSGVGVTLSGTSGGSTVTDVNGNYSFPNLLTGGDFTVTPTRAGYQFAPPNRSVTNLQSNQTANFAATAIYTISGQITFNGSGLSGANVVLSGGASNSTTTDANGNYSFATLPSGGNYTVTPSLTGYTFDPVNRSFTNIQANQLANFAATQLVVYSINGQITYNGSGLSGATIALSGTSSSSTTTDSNGNYSLANLPSGGTFTVTPSKLGYMFVPSNITFNNLSTNQIGNFTATVPVAGGLDLDYKAGVQNPNFLGLTGDGRFQAIAIQPDGKHIIAGRFRTANSTGRINIARFYPDGTLDETFDPGVGFPGGIALDIALQPDGKIIVGGEFTSFTNTQGVIPKFGIVRLNSDGSLDNTFNPGQGVSGKVKVVVRQPDGKILIGGQFTTVGGVARANIARLNEDGSLDDSFVVGTGSNGIINAIALQSDGKVVIGGELSAYNGTLANRLTRVDAGGVLDPSFNIGTGPNTGTISALKAQPDGKILVGGDFAQFNGQPGKWIVRLNPNGSRDTFLEGTICNSLCTLPNPPQQFSVLANGQIYISSMGSVNPNGNAWGWALLRYNADGGRDTSFNPPYDGVAASLTIINRHAVQADGSVIGTNGRFLTSSISGPYSHIRRLSPTGAVDITYKPMLGDAGTASSGSFVWDVALQADGKLLAGGNFSMANNELRYDVARFNTNGTLDTSFTYPLAGQTIYKILPLPDGKIIVGGAVEVGALGRYGVARLNSNGSLDTTFVGTGAFGGNTAVFGAALQPDGKIIIVGRFNTYNGVARSGIARPHPDGSLDESFNVGTGLSVSGGGHEPYDIKILPDGKIVVVGYFSAYNGITREGVVRINSNGSVDESFNPNGQGFLSFKAVELLANGQLLVGGDTFYRLNSNGTRDNTFLPPSLPGGVSEIRLLSNGKILIAGNMATEVGPRRAGVMRLQSTGALDLSFGDGLRGADYGDTTGFAGLAVDEANNHIYYGGNLFAYNNVGRGSIARIFLNSIVTTVAVTVDTNPAGRAFTVDGTNYSSPQTFNWEPGSPHTIATTSPQASTAGTQYVWANWSDGGAISHTVTTPNAAATYTANFTTQHQLTMNAGAGGTVTPSSGFYNAGETVPITATPNSGFIFSNWTGSGNGSYSGANNPASVTMNEPLTQTANFTQCGYTLNPAGANVSAAGGSASFAVTAPAGCAWTAASNAAWLTTSSAGSGNGTVNFTVSSNPGAARSASITVSGQTFTVNQIAAGNTNDQPILFTSSRDGNSEIYRMNADGTNQQRLTDSPENEALALWSPGGAKIAFSRIVSSTQQQIWTMNPDGSNKLLISDAAGVHVLHGWSPNGQKILFGKRESSSVENLWTMNPDGSGKLQLTNAGAIDHIADWSKDGSRIAFGRCTPQFVCDVFTINAADGSNPANLTPANPNDDDGAKWTPDGRIVFGSQTTPDDYNVYIMNADGSSKQPLTSAVPPLSYSPAQVSPAGGKVAMTYRGATASTFEISTVSLNGSGLVNLTNNSVLDLFGAWSPDGQRIAFRSRRDAATDEIYVMNADGSAVVRLTFNSATDNVTDWLRPGAPRRAPFDFDSDGKTDISIFRPSDGSWWYLQSSDQQFRVFRFGVSTDRLVPGDYTGDGKTDLAVFRPATGEWFIQRSEDNSFFSFPFGAAGDIPAPSDYDGDGKADAAVYRPSSGTWFILNSNGSGTSIIGFGTPEDKPVAADFDGDSKADIAIFRPSDGSWWYLRSSDSQFRVFRFGVSSDKPVVGDYTGDGKADLAVFRPSTGEWFVQRSEDNSYFSFIWGQSGDIPTPGDYDGDGRFDTSVYRPSNSTWYRNQTTAGVGIVTFGSAGDVPVPNAFVP